MNYLVKTKKKERELERINDNDEKRLSKTDCDLSAASRLIICRCRRQKQIIDLLRVTDKSSYFAETESNNCSSFE